MSVAGSADNAGYFVLAFLSLLRSQYGGGRLRNVWGSDTREVSPPVSQCKADLMSSPVCILISDLATWTPGHLDLGCRSAGARHLSLDTSSHPQLLRPPGSAAKITVARGLCVGRVFLCPGLVCAAWLWPRLECDCVATKPGT